MTCREAPTCRAALTEATRRWPTRRRTSDGICASDEHRRRSPVSDHNDGSAFDLGHDPAAGVDCHQLVAAIVARRDPRVKYVIWNRTIWRSYFRPAKGTRPELEAWAPERYDGPNPHTSHAHISTKPEARNDRGPWFADQEDDDLTPDESRKLDEIHAFVKANTAKMGKLDENADGRMNHTIEATAARVVERLKGPLDAIRTKLGA